MANGFSETEKGGVVMGNWQAVIGSHYGDCGKGVVTDVLSGPETLVVRFNGGSQAGHTVTTPEGLRHEFQHFGAGTFRGARTLFSRHTIVSPSRFLRERDELCEKLGVSTLPAFYVDPRALVTTPYDMLINRAVEDHRRAAGQQHGSCGYGINETVTRSEQPEFRITADMLKPERIELLRATLQVIREHWVPRRCAALGIAFVLADGNRYSTVADAFIADARAFARSVTIFDDATVLATAKDVVFEGAQGLRLCQSRTQDFPHVTRSYTGTRNVIELVQAAGYSGPLTVHYVTRPYVTRHGAGPLPGELGTTHPYGWKGPETNVPNQYQGVLRYAKLDARQLLYAIAVDRSNTSVDVDPYIVMTCLDQLPDDACIDVKARVQEATELPFSLLTYGPTRNDVVAGHAALRTV